MKPSNLRDYRPTAGPCGASTAKNIAYWSNRAAENSPQHSHAVAGANGGTARDRDVPRVPSTGGKVDLHSTSKPPRRKRI